MQKVNNFQNDKDYYSDWKYITNSQLGYIKKGWEYYMMMKNGVKLDSPALRFGNLLHTLILEPEKYQEKFFVLNDEDRPEPTKSMASKLNKAWKNKMLTKIENDNKILIDLNQYNLALTLRDKVKSFKIINDFIHNSKKEIAKTWLDFNTLVECKGKVDMLIDDNMIIDIKTTSKPITQFKKSAFTYDYHRQAAFYSDGFNVKEFIFLVVETNEPYQVGLFRCSEEFLDRGRQECFSLLNTYKDFLNKKESVQLIEQEL
tara:strand:+ start:1233 stop:2009 length:777 start_codon:yes stop_codon:yes gene_type:complete